MDFDVIVAGASFAGLAVAAGLRNRRVLLIDPHDIGDVQTSACGTLLAVLEATHTMTSLLQVHHQLVLHFSHRTVEYPMPYSFCTFDYQIFCRHLLAQSHAEVLKASVLGHRGHTVLTSCGEFSAPILVDASGWRSALATNGMQQTSSHSGLSFGLETVIQAPEQGLHFYYEPDLLKPYNVGWLFPVGMASRVGFGSYRGQSQLNEGLQSFVQNQFSVSPHGRHGGFFPNRRQPATSGPVFRVGDSAGQCIPLTGEGIRPAIYFGSAVARMAQKVLTGELTEYNALAAYRRYVEDHRWGYRFLLAAQAILPRLPNRWIDHLATLVRSPALLDRLLWFYWRWFNPGKIANFSHSEHEYWTGNHWVNKISLVENQEK